VVSRLAVAVALVACAAHDREPPAPVAPPPKLKPPLVAPGPRLPDGAEPLAYDLRLEIDPDSDAFTGHVAIRVRLSAPADHVWLDLDELDITRAAFHTGTAAAQPLAPVASGDEMRAFGFGRELPAGEVVLELDYVGHMKHDEQGLFRQIAGKRHYVFSQGETVFARRIVPCFDEPRWKTPWKVTLVVPRDQVALGNAPQVRASELAGGKREVELAETPPMASYVLAIAVGPFELVDAGSVGRAKVPLRVAVPAGLGKRVGVVAARTPAIVAAAEDMLRGELPLAKLDLVVVPHLFGAMENPGLITFDQNLVVGDPSRGWFARRFVFVAAHELVHQWFGNSVTPAWWNELWLAEAFASWLGDRIAERLGMVDDPELRRALAREDALAADREPDAKPLRPVIRRGDDAEDIFDSIAYDKGAVVLASVAAFEGEDAFVAWLDTYLQRKRGGTAVAADLYASVGKSASRALASYVDHAGVPVVEAKLHCDGAPGIALRARGDVAVPVCVRYGDAHGMHRACELVTSKETELGIEGGCPTWFVPNDRAGYYEVVGALPPVDKLSRGELVAAGDDVADGFARGDVAAAAALDALGKLAATRDVYAQLGALAIAHAIDPLVADAQRAAWSAWLAKRFAARLSPGAVLAPATTAEGAVRDRLVGLVAAADLPPATIAAARDRLAHAARGVEHNPLVVWAAGRADPAAALTRWLARQVPIDAAWVWMSDFERGSLRGAAWRAIEPQLDKVLDQLGANATDLLDGAAELCDPAARGELATAFASRVHEARDRRRVEVTLGAIDRCVARRDRAAEIAAALTHR
jgi:alanyl aminopeptidase